MAAIGWRGKTGGVSPGLVLRLLFAGKAEMKNRSVLTKFVDDAKKRVILS